MTAPSSPPRPTDHDPVLRAALATWRDDAASVAPAPRLAERVLREVARRADEVSRFRRLARWYGAAATLTAAAGLAGALLAGSGGLRPLVPGRDAGPPPSVFDLEEARVARLGLDAVAHLVVGTPAAANDPDGASTASPSPLTPR